MSMLTELVRLPAPMEVRDALGDLFDREVTVSPAAPWVPEPRDPGTFALYIDDALVVRTVVVCDLAFAATAATAIGLLPTKRAAAAFEEGLLPEELRENLDEILNICAGLQNGEDAVHLRLYKVHHAGVSVPPAVLALSGVRGRRLDLAVRIAGYGAGQLSFVGKP